MASKKVIEEIKKIEEVRKDLPSKPTAQ